MASSARGPIQKSLQIGLLPASPESLLEMEVANRPGEAGDPEPPEQAHFNRGSRGRSSERSLGTGLGRVRSSPRPVLASALARERDAHSLMDVGLLVSTLRRSTASRDLSSLCLSFASPHGWLPQAARWASGPRVSCEAPVPSAFIVQIWYVPDRLLTNAIFVPSGDHESAPAFSVPPDSWVN